MEFIKTKIFGAYIIKPKIYKDKRGYFFESFNQKLFNQIVKNITFLQDNHSQSKKGVLRGLHYQIKKPQGNSKRLCVNLM